MAEMIVYGDGDFSTSKWSGGVTTELFIWPEGASYAERRFDFRISTALVELEESRFTSLPGVERYLTPLCESGFSLAINGRAPVRLGKGSVLRFSGADDITCYGSGRDLNLMLKGRVGDMKCLPACASYWLGKAEFAFVYAAEGMSVSLTDENGTAIVRLEAGGFARISGSGCLSVTGNAVLFTVC